MHEALVNRLGGLSLPRKSVVRLTDRPDMILDVYRGRKTTTHGPRGRCLDSHVQVFPLDEHLGQGRYPILTLLHIKRLIYIETAIFVSLLSYLIPENFQFLYYYPHCITGILSYGAVKLPVHHQSADFTFSGRLQVFISVMSVIVPKLLI